MENLKKIAVLGIGLKGLGISQVALMAGFKVTLFDLEKNHLDNGLLEIKENLQKLQNKSYLKGGQKVDILMENIEFTTKFNHAVKNADFIIENLVDKLEIKQDVFKKCGEIAPLDSIFASNTSMLSISDIAKYSGKPEKCIGMHFFYPIPLMRLIEVIASKKSSEEAVNLGVELASQFPCVKGKRYVAKVLKDRPGFLVNRLNAPNNIYMSYIFDIAAEKGIPWEQIDADTEGFMPMGPCELIDYIGIDITTNVMNYYSETLSPHFKPGKILEEMVSSGNFGKSTGKGFYDWTDGRPVIDKSKKAGLFNIEEALAINLNEGCRILEEKIVNGYKIIDDANNAGMNVPGPFITSKKRYLEYCDLLENLADYSGIDYFKPCDLMKSGKFLQMRK